jgi:hypothetical protein
MIRAEESATNSYINQRATQLAYESTEAKRVYAMMTDNEEDLAKVEYDNAMYALNSKMLVNIRASSLVSDEELARVKEVTEYQKGLLTKEYDEKKKQIAIRKGNVLLQGDSQKLSEDIALVAKSGNLGGVFGGSMIQGTETGAMATGGDFFTMFVATFGEMLGQVEMFSKILNPINTILSTMFQFLSPIIDAVLKPLVKVLQAVGVTMAAVLYPVIALFSLLSSIINAVVEKLRDFINWMIRGINKFIEGINKWIEWTGMQIPKMKEWLDEADLPKMLNQLSIDMDYLSDKIKEEADLRKDSIRDLYEVGAISATDYEAQVKAINDLIAPLEGMDDVTQALRDTPMTLEEMVEVWKKMDEANTQAEQGSYEMLQLIYRDFPTWLKDYISDSPSPGASARYGGTEGMSGAISKEVLDQLAYYRDRVTLAQRSGNFAEIAEYTALYNTLASSNGLPYYAKGTNNITQDGLAFLHKGEAVIPAKDNGPFQPSGETVYINVEVHGSVKSENDLIDAIASGLSRRRMTGATVR